jgi:hypothetical protein
MSEVTRDSGFNWPKSWVTARPKRLTDMTMRPLSTRIIPAPTEGRPEKRRKRQLLPEPGGRPALPHQWC